MTYQILPAGAWARIKPDPHNQVVVDVPLGSEAHVTFSRAMRGREPTPGGPVGLQGEWMVTKIVERPAEPMRPVEVTLWGKEARK